MTATPKYPNVVVPLVGNDRNAFAIIGAVRLALREAGVTDTMISVFTSEAIGSGSYEALLGVVMAWVDVT
jgi:hypothetical protein